MAGPCGDRAEHLEEKRIAAVMITLMAANMISKA
jgi:hypothetical protein